MKRIQLMLFAVGIVLALGACSSSQPAPAPTPPPTETAAETESATEPDTPAQETAAEQTATEQTAAEQTAAEQSSGEESAEQQAAEQGASEKAPADQAQEQVAEQQAQDPEKAPNDLGQRGAAEEAQSGAESAQADTPANGEQVDPSAIAARTMEGEQDPSTLQSGTENGTADPQDSTAMGGKAAAGLEEVPFQTVYFPFDKAHLSAEMKKELDQNSEWIIAQKSIRIRLEGHCDVRGTDEYNIWLGQQRANRVLQYLIGNGVGPDILATTSWGKEKPATEGDDDESHQLNRRVEFVIVTEEDQNSAALSILEPLVN